MGFLWLARNIWGFGLSVAPAQIFARLPCVWGDGLGTAHEPNRRPSSGDCHGAITPRDRMRIAGHGLGINGDGLGMVQRKRQRKGLALSAHYEMITKARGRTQ